LAGAVVAAVVVAFAVVAVGAVLVLFSPPHPASATPLAGCSGLSNIGA
jgi:hypothetical protein